MIEAAELLRCFHRHYIAYVLYHTNNGRVALGIGTNAASLRIRNIVAHLAILHFMFQRNNSIAESLHRSRVLPQQVKYQPHGRLSAHPRQLGELVYRLFQ